MTTPSNADAPLIIDAVIRNARIARSAGDETITGEVYSDRRKIFKDGETVTMVVTRRLPGNIVQTQNAVYRVHGAVPEPAPRMVTITLPLDYAERLTFSLSDLLCWHAGYASAKGDDAGNAPMGIHDAREFNIKLKSAIEEATK